MGYESRFYVIEKSTLKPDNGKVFSSIIAMFDMCKLGYESSTMKLVQKAKETDCYIYADDGNTKILKDKYDEFLKEIPVDDLIVALKKDDDGYRRIKPFVAFLKSLDATKWRELKVLHFGY
jgi:hypothetical protein